MKIRYINNLEDLSEYKYNYKTDTFRRNNLYYKFKPGCCECGDPYFMRISSPTEFCSRLCANKSLKTRSKISNSLKKHVRTNEHRLNISKSKLKLGGVVKKNLPLFDTYAKQLLPVEEVKNDNGILLVRCVYCKQWFQPKRTQVELRAQFIKGNTDRESRFYCSSDCKSKCPVFNKRSNYIISNYLLKLWSNEVLSRAGYKCEYCGSGATEAHHIIPKKLNHFFALDPDNGIACCRECHIEKAHKDYCNFVSLANKKC